MTIRARFVKLTSQASGQITAISLASSINQNRTERFYQAGWPFIAVQGKRGRVSFIPWQVAPGITKDQAEHSLFQTLSQVHDVHVAKTTEALEIALADEKVSGLLDCPLGTPCFYIETVTEDASGRTIEYSRSYFRGDKTSFVIERSYS